MLSNELEKGIYVAFLRTTTNCTNGCRRSLCRSQCHPGPHGTQIRVWYPRLPPQNFHRAASRVGSLVCAYDQKAHLASANHWVGNRWGTGYAIGRAAWHCNDSFYAAAPSHEIPFEESSPS